MSTIGDSDDFDDSFDTEPDEYIESRRYMPSQVDLPTSIRPITPPSFPSATSAFQPVKKATPVRDNEADDDGGGGGGGGEHGNKIKEMINVSPRFIEPNQTLCHRKIPPVPQKKVNKKIVRDPGGEPRLDYTETEVICQLPDLVASMTNISSGVPCGGHPRYISKPPPVLPKKVIYQPSTSVPVVSSALPDPPKKPAKYNAKHPSERPDSSKLTYPRQPAPPVPKFPDVTSKKPAPSRLTAHSRQNEDRDLTVELRQYSWFFSNLSRTEAETKVRSHRMDGAFVVRQSEQGSDEQRYSLTLLCRGSVHHLRVRCRHGDKMYAIGEPKPNEPVFYNVQQLIEFYTCNPIALALPPGKAKRSVMLQYCQQ